MIVAAMRMPARVLLLLAAAGLVLAGVAPARALNQRIYSLAELLQDTETICVGRVIASERSRMRAALLIEECVRGDPGYRWMAVNVAPGGWGHPGPMMARLVPGVPVVVFTARVKQRHVVLGFVEGTWFQLTAPVNADARADQNALPWSFTHAEVFLRRTFAGTSAELEAILRDVVSGKRTAPAPNPAVGQGWGPEPPRDYRPAKPLPELPAVVVRALAELRSPIRRIAVRPLTPEEQAWVKRAAMTYHRADEDVEILLAQARYSSRDAERALQYERDHGRGGNRAWVRSAEEILDLKYRSDRLSWLDVRGVLMRAGELFTPVTDPVELIHGLRTRYSWDELDPMFDDDKWGRRKLADAVRQKDAARLPHPLNPGEKLGPPVLNIDMGEPGVGDIAMESVGWRPLPGGSWDLARRQFGWLGGVTGLQRPGSVVYTAPGSKSNPLRNLPPRPGLALAARAGEYSGAALCFGTGMGDYLGASRGGNGAMAGYDDEWVQVRQGESRSFLIVAQVYVPDQSDAVGEPRAGWFYINRSSRYIDVGLRVLDAAGRTISLAPDPALLIKVEPTMARFDRVLLRVDVVTSRAEGKRHSEGRNELKLIAFLDGVGECARAVLDLNKARRGNEAVIDGSSEGVVFAPAFGSRRPDAGYVPEFYLASARVHPISATEGPEAVTLVQRSERVRVERVPAPLPDATRTPGRPMAVLAAKPAPASTTPRRVVMIVDTSSSMAPYLEKARTEVLETLASLGPNDRFALLKGAATASAFLPDWSVATPAAVEQARAWVRGLTISPGTNTSQWLERALAFPGVSLVVLVTDGGPPSAGITSPDALSTFVRERNVGRARLNAVLVTPAASDNIASRLALEQRGSIRLR